MIKRLFKLIKILFIFGAGFVTGAVALLKAAAKLCLITDRFTDFKRLIGNVLFDLMFPKRHRPVNYQNYNYYGYVHERQHYTPPKLELPKFKIKEAAQEFFDALVNYNDYPMTVDDFIMLAENIDGYITFSCNFNRDTSLYGWESIHNLRFRKPKQISTCCWVVDVSDPVPLRIS